MRASERRVVLDLLAPGVRSGFVGARVPRPCDETPAAEDVERQHGEDAGYLGGFGGGGGGGDRHRCGAWMELRGRGEVR